ncbi:MAG: ABC transporter permease [Geothrix sp.]|uniref:ABC transporter permease n=1 Tax=Candidatus Geothrix odensensis TaxID=2954440 RepID=A0A936K6C6_9BACT|nr:ABC transporter permease [Candidatus Geothrix odensensis]MBK8790462.1 ABC transporter permease [Holophagaceae bacterium]MBP7617661.1 ABC transporter permease [Geothrix sp.]
MKASGAFRERLFGAWVEIRENLGRSVLQALGVLLGVASVLGGFSISDSQRKRADEMFVKMGGLDKLNVQPRAAIKDGRPTALQQANLGLRDADAVGGEALQSDAIQGVSRQKNTRSRVVSAYADQDRQVSGIGGDFIPANGYGIAQGRGFSNMEMEIGAPVVVLGTEAANTFFPKGDALGQSMRIGDIPVTVIGTFQERVFRFRENQGNQFWWRNRIIAVPANLVQRRMNGDAYRRVDRVTFRIPDLNAMSGFAQQLKNLVKSNHRLQEDFRLDDVAARVRRRQSQGSVYDIIFMLSGVLALVGGGIVNVNIQMASLKERVREVGVKMAIGASGREIFKGFMTEALLLTALGGFAGLVLGIGFSWIITASIGIPLYMTPASFVWAYGLAAAFGFLFALYPAWKASRLSPMEALRYE